MLGAVAARAAVGDDERCPAGASGRGEGHERDATRGLDATVRAVGTRRIHQVDPAGLRALRADLDAYWGGALANLKELAEEENRA